MNVSVRIGTLFDFSAVQLLCEPFFGFANVSGMKVLFWTSVQCNNYCCANLFWICERFWEDRCSF